MFQLSEVNHALEQTGLAPEDKLQLEELQHNLVQLLELTLDQMQQIQQHSGLTSATHETASELDNIDEADDDEWALFQVCI